MFIYEYRRNKGLFVALQQLRDVSLAAFAAIELNGMFSGTQQQQGVKVSGETSGNLHILLLLCAREHSIEKFTECAPILI